MAREDHSRDLTYAIDPETGCDAEDLFCQVEWYQGRGLLHPNDDIPRLRAERHRRKPADP